MAGLVLTVPQSATTRPARLYSHTPTRIRRRLRTYFCRGDCAALGEAGDAVRSDADGTAGAVESPAIAAVGAEVSDDDAEGGGSGSAG